MTLAIDRGVETDTPTEVDPKTPLKIGIPNEVHPGENRVAATPQTVKVLQKMGFEVLIESGAGASATFPDAA